jgi:hypothetical protein
MILMDDKMVYLRQLKNDLDDETFRYVAAEVAIKYYTNMFIGRGLRVSKSKVLDRTNLTLKALGVDEVSYGYVRQFA